MLGKEVVGSQDSILCLTDIVLVALPAQQTGQVTGPGKRHGISHGMETFVTVGFSLPKQAELRPPPDPACQTTLSEVPGHTTA